LAQKPVCCVLIEKKPHNGTNEQMALKVVEIFQVFSHNFIDRGFPFMEYIFIGGIEFGLKLV
jgi:hypothetical protein